MAGCNPEIGGHLGKALRIERARFDSLYCIVSEPFYSINRCSTGRQLGPTYQAWPETRILRGCSRLKEPSIGALRRPRGADAPTIDAGRRDTSKELAIVTSFSSLYGCVAGLFIELHVRNMGRPRHRVSPETDLRMIKRRSSIGSPHHLQRAAKILQYSIWGFYAASARIRRVSSEGDIHRGRTVLVA